jgi:glycine cleavage system aminomethyltransferase T
MNTSATPPDTEHRSPLENVLRSHGATMVERNGRCVAAHFGSATSEAAVCLSTVGIADRGDRATLELRGAPDDVEVALSALAALRSRSWFSRVTPRSAIVRCEGSDAPACRGALAALEGTTVLECGDRFAAIGIVGPRARELLRARELEAAEVPAVVLRETDASFEILVQATQGPAQWEKLLEIGAPFAVACVGLDALEHLAASHRLGSAIG